MNCARITRTVPVAPTATRPSRQVRSNAEAAKKQVIQPINGDPFVGMLETPVTSAPIVAGFLSRLPIYRVGVSPLLRGVEIGLAHGFLVCGPFIKLGPLRNMPGTAEVSGCVSGAGLVVILSACLSIYAARAFEGAPDEAFRMKTLSGRELPRDPLLSADGWGNFTAGFLIGGLAGCGWAYACTQILPFYY